MICTAGVRFVTYMYVHLSLFCTLARIIPDGGRHEAAHGRNEGACG